MTTARRSRTWEDLDPDACRSNCAQAAAKQPGKKKVILTVRREPSEPTAAEGHRSASRSIGTTAGTTTRKCRSALRSPLAIPQLGVAYWVLSQIVEVKDGFARRAGAALKKDDTIKEIVYASFREFSKEPELEQVGKLEIGAKRQPSSTIAGRSRSGSCS